MMSRYDTTIVWGVWGKKKANEPSRSSERSSRTTCSCDCLRFLPS
jgi:hypothetical protein